MSAPLSHSDILRWLREDDPCRLTELWRMADETRRAHVGDAVHLRGLVEISNHCVRQCGYCGLRLGNRPITRYRMSAEEILAAAQQAVKFGYGTVVMQAGEDPGITLDWMTDLIRKIKSQTPLAVTLSLGERSESELVAWRAAGADRYLMRFETSDRALFDFIHPPLGNQPSDRIALLRRIKALGYETGSGIMIGLPGQTYESVANDIALFRELDLDMIGIGPFIPHPATPLGSARGSRAESGGPPDSRPTDSTALKEARETAVEPLTPSLSPSDGERVPARAGEGSSAGSPIFHGFGSLGLENDVGETKCSAGRRTPHASGVRSPDQIPATELMVYKAVALTRLVRPDANIPSTSALATINKRNGRELGLQRGANVFMPNLTPIRYRRLYEIYPAKACIDETGDQCNGCLRLRISGLGRHVGQGQGGRRQRTATNEPLSHE